MSTWLEDAKKVDEIMKTTRAKQLSAKITSTDIEVKQHDLEFKPVEVDLIPPELRTNEQWAEIIPRGIASKCHFTVTIPRETNDKFNDLMVFYQNKFALGRVYKHYVLSIVIHEHWSKLQKEGLV